MSAPPPTDPRIASLPALVAGARGAVRLGGEQHERLELAAAGRAWRRGGPHLVCHRFALAARLEVEPPPALDLLELFAFVRPARFCLPTPRGLARALALPVPESLEQQAETLRRAARLLMEELAAPETGDPAEVAAVARPMAAAGWAWGQYVVPALDRAAYGELRPDAPGLAVWRTLPEWSEMAPEPPPGSLPVRPEEARGRLAELLGTGAEARPQQADYAAAASGAFLPRERLGEPHVVLAEAGTGIGKTLGYIAPSSLWAERNKGAVWISTYTRNLQHQIDRELDRLVPDTVAKARRVVVRKGRENYLCLLNLEEAARGAMAGGRDAVALGLMARWAAATRDGDMAGGDFPTWLADLMGTANTLGLTDRRGECVYSACTHWKRCFIERNVRRARRADLVVANHALVMVQAALGGLDDAYVPQRYVFDEGHHVFDAADNAFSSHLSGRGMTDLRRWVLGAEGRRGSRARGLRRRVGDLCAGAEKTERLLSEAERAARALPAEGWHQRIAEGQPHGPAESFLAVLRQQVYARAAARDGPYGLEAETRPPLAGLVEAADALAVALKALGEPLERLAAALRDRLENADEAEELDPGTRIRIEAACRGLERRAKVDLAAWRSMLASLHADTPPEFVDWLAVERAFGRDMDVGMRRHWVDPTIPFAATVAARAHGLVVTSATLTDGTGEEERDWEAAERRTGAAHLPRPAARVRIASPFDYPAHTAVLIVNDVRKDELGQVAAAYHGLIRAAGGGALGLFTAISRLRAVHSRIAAALEAEGLPLLAQHVDGLDTATLVEIFRAEEDASLLGTDAVRDGVDVPGRSLRLIVFDRVPWPRPDVLHKARRAAFGGRGYDDMITRLRLKQAFGRLVRRADDRGVFILLDPMMPSRLLGAFPPGVPVERLGLAEAIGRVRAFLSPGT